MKRVDVLNHGGIMANYRCTAACRHCLYSCSPDRGDGYISKDVAESVCGLLCASWCRSVHIGGGEPFLDFDGLLTLIKVARNAGIRVEYIETNAFWAADHSLTADRLKELARAGADTLCISVDPFHAEYIPLELPLSLAAVCHDVGFGYFMWQDRYLSAMTRLDRGKTHSRAEMEQLISPKYVIEVAQSYGLHMGGRAIGIEDEHSFCKPVKKLINARPCYGLLSGNHFHVDMFGRFIPPGCTGIVLPLDEAVHGIPDGKYPVFEALLNGGTAALLEYATNLGFEANSDGYTSNCAMCFYIRRWLSESVPSPELDPEHYVEAMKYW